MNKFPDGALTIYANSVILAAGTSSTSTVIPQNAANVTASLLYIQAAAAAYIQLSPLTTAAVTTATGILVTVNTPLLLKCRGSSCIAAIALTATVVQVSPVEIG